MKRFVWDEWLWADLNGENGEEAQREAVLLLEAVFQKCDQLVTVQGSPFVQKYYAMTRQANTIILTKIVKIFKYQFLHNSEKLQLLEEQGLPGIPADLEPTIKEDDRYLVRAYLAVKADLLVTTDNPLMEALHDWGIRCQDRDTFVSDYLENDPIGDS
jgi:predicted nucleic acid-binding protein